jgi:uncharacterized protein related to proFAR isomerase
MHVKDKQAFTDKGGMMRLIGKPIDVAKRWKEEGCVLIHIVDTDAIKGTSTNLDIYDNMTYFVNIEVECSPLPAIVTKLLTLKCRVVLPPSAGLSVSGMAERKLLVAKIPSGMEASEKDLENFHDVVLEDSDDVSVRRYRGFGKRVIIYEKDWEKMKERKKVWGIISTS